MTAREGGEVGARRLGLAKPFAQARDRALFELDDPPHDPAIAATG